MLHAVARSTRHARAATGRLLSSSSGGNGNGAARGSASPYDRFWAWTTQARPTWRENGTEAAVIFCVFGITGSSSVAVVRPFLKQTIGLEGSMREGPWSYRILSLVLVSPIYATLLLTFGTVAGRHTFFANMARKIFGRLLPPSLARRVGCGPALKKSPPPPPAA